MRHPVKKRKESNPDIKYSSVLVTKLINQVMKDGKKTIAERIVYSSLEKAEKKLGKPALDILNRAIENAGPDVELRSKRVGGANYQVPHEVSQSRKITLALRWILAAAVSKKGKPMAEKLAEELSDAFGNAGTAIKKKQDTHRMADANKAFARFAW